MIVRNACFWQHESSLEKVINIMEFAFFVAKLVTGQETVLPLPDDSMLSKLNKQNKSALINLKGEDECSWMILKLSFVLH